MKRIIFSLVLGILLVAVLVAPVLAGYYATLTVTEANGNAYTQVGLIEDVDVSYLADNGYISSTGLDTRVTSAGTAIPHLMVDDSILFSMPLAAYETNNLQFTTDNAALSDFYVVTGDGGYVTVTDHANLELGDDFEVEFDGYIDTSTDVIFINKDYAFDIRTTSGDVIGIIYDTQSSIEQIASDNDNPIYSGSTTRAGQRIDSFPVGVITQLSFQMKKTGLPTGTAYARARAVSDDSIIGTFGTLDVSTLGAGATWEDFTTDVFNPTSQDIRFTIEYEGGDVANFVVVRYRNADVVTGVETLFNGSWVDDSGDDITFKLYWYPEDVSVSATVASGETQITVAADTTDLTLDIDGSTEDTIALGGASVNDNANDWIIANLPYYDYYNHTTSSTLRIDYDPDSIIVGTTLPNEDAPGTYDGTITWGSNPGGVTVTLGGLVSDEQLIPAGAGADFPEPQDIAGPSGQPGMTTDVGTLTTNPLYPIVSTISDTTSLPVGVVWVMGATFILALLFVWMIGDQQMMHQMFIGLAGGGWVAFCWHLGIYPFWVIFIYAVLAIAIVIGERSPTIS